MRSKSPFSTVSSLLAHPKQRKPRKHTDQKPLATPSSIHPLWPCPMPFSPRLLPRLRRGTSPSSPKTSTSLRRSTTFRPRPDGRTDRSAGPCRLELRSTDVRGHLSTVRRDGRPCDGTVWIPLKTGGREKDRGDGDVLLKVLFWTGFFILELI